MTQKEKALDLVISFERMYSGSQKKYLEPPFEESSIDAAVKCASEVLENIPALIPIEGARNASVKNPKKKYWQDVIRELHEFYPKDDEEYPY